MDSPISFRRRGMSLVELLVVVAVLSALVALLLPATPGSRSETAAARASGHAARSRRFAGC